MSALREMLASLWAGVWLGWRMLGVRVRRLWGGSLVASGPSFHLAKAETLVEGTDYDIAELPADLVARLEAVRAELVGAADGRTLRGRPMRQARSLRTALAATASLLALAVFGAAAAALVTGSTGVPAVDRLLGIVQGLDQSRTPADLGRGSPPSPAPSAVPVEASLGQTGHRVVATAYLSEDGTICRSATRTDTDRDTGLGSVKCFDPAALDSHLAQNGGSWGITREEGAVVVHGLVRGDVARLLAQGPNGPLSVHLGDPWKPDRPDVGAMRPFLAIGDIGLGAEGSGNAIDRLMQPSEYALEGRLDDGRDIPIAP